MSVRWKHCINHADKQTKAEKSPECLIGVVPQPTDSRLNETSTMSRTQSLNSHVDMESSSQDLTADYIKSTQTSNRWLKCSQQTCLGFNVSVDVYVVNILNTFGLDFRDFFRISSLRCPCI